MILWITSGCVSKRVQSFDVTTQISLQSIGHLEPAFVQLSDLERCTEWGKELQFGKQFAIDGDLETALFCFKRSLMATRNSRPTLLRLQEIDYDLFLTYYLMRRYKEANSAFEQGKLGELESSNPLRPQLLALLIESYDKAGKNDQALKLLAALRHENQEVGNKIASWYQATHFGEISPELSAPYAQEIKLIKKEMVHPITSEILNAVIPGLGYAILGQYKTAFTSLALNALFITAGVQFIAKGAVAAGIITLGLETGWYVGGIYGGGLAAQYYNEQLWKKRLQPLFERERLFPLSQLSYGF